MATTSIEWTRGDDGKSGVAWNPVTGCDKVSDGCSNCYALKMSKRLKLMGSEKYQSDGDPQTSGPGFGLTMHPDVLSAPLRWRKPRRVFVNSMSDLFHKAVSDDFIAQVFGVMAANHQHDGHTHTFMILTKRHARMRSLLSSSEFRLAVASAAARLTDEQHADRVHDNVLARHWPLPNVWLGVSAENQHWANIRIPALLETPAAIRFISAEPLLGPIDLNAVRVPDRPGAHRMVDWVITGGESGPNHRPVDVEWVRGLRDQCQDAGVAFFHKQWGGLRPKSNGNLLDGRTWAHMPAGSQPSQLAAAPR